MRNFVFLTVIVALAAFMYLAAGVPFNVFTAWNMLPLLISLILYALAIKREYLLYGAYGFLLGSMLVSGFFHLSWLFDWDETATGSSTSGLAFIFIPFYSLVSGGIGFAIGTGVGRART
jgi:hypothetical protein